MVQMETPATLSYAHACQRLPRLTAPHRTYELSAGGASGPSGQVLKEQRQRLIAVVLTDTKYAQRPLGGSEILSLCPQIERGVTVRIGGRGGRPALFA
jgi:hypothetical protein